MAVFLAGQEPVRISECQKPAAGLLWSRRGLLSPELLSRHEEMNTPVIVQPTQIRPLATNQALKPTAQPMRDPVDSHRCENSCPIYVHQRTCVRVQQPESAL